MGKKCSKECPEINKLQRTQTQARDEEETEGNKRIVRVPCLSDEYPTSAVCALQDNPYLKERSVKCRNPHAPGCLVTEYKQGPANVPRRTSSKRRAPQPQESQNQSPQGSIDSYVSPRTYDDRFSRSSSTSERSQFPPNHQDPRTSGNRQSSRDCRQLPDRPCSRGSRPPSASTISSSSQNPQRFQSTRDSRQSTMPPISRGSRPPSASTISKSSQNPQRFQSSRDTRQSTMPPISRGSRPPSESTVSQNSQNPQKLQNSRGYRQAQDPPSYESSRVTRCISNDRFYKNSQILECPEDCSDGQQYYQNRQSCYNRQTVKTTNQEPEDDEYHDQYPQEYGTQDKCQECSPCLENSNKVEFSQDQGPRRSSYRQSRRSTNEFPNSVDPEESPSLQSQQDPQNNETTQSPEDHEESQDQVPQDPENQQDLKNEQGPEDEQDPKNEQDPNNQQDSNNQQNSNPQQCPQNMCFSSQNTTNQTLPCPVAVQGTSCPCALFAQFLMSQGLQNSNATNQNPRISTSSEPHVPLCSNICTVAPEAQNSQRPSYVQQNSAPRKTRQSKANEDAPQSPPLQENPPPPQKKGKNAPKDKDDSSKKRKKCSTKKNTKDKPKSKKEYSPKKKKSSKENDDTSDQDEEEEEEKEEEEEEEEDYQYVCFSTPPANRRPVSCSGLVPSAPPLTPPNDLRQVQYPMCRAAPVPYSPAPPSGAARYSWTPQSAPPVVCNRQPHRGPSSNSGSAWCQPEPNRGSPAPPWGTPEPNWGAPGTPGPNCIAQGTPESNWGTTGTPGPNWGAQGTPGPNWSPQIHVIPCSSQPTTGPNYGSQPTVGPWGPTRPQPTQAPLPPPVSCNRTCPSARPPF